MHCTMQAFEITWILSVRNVLEFLREKEEINQFHPLAIHSNDESNLQKRWCQILEENSAFKSFDALDNAHIMICDK